MEGLKLLLVAGMHSHHVAQALSLLSTRACCTAARPPPPQCKPITGAYKGRGRGNAFLNDLCDADVLVHVVDASGTTDAEGAGAAPGEGADPRQEVV